MRVDIILLSLGVVACLAAAPFLIILADFDVGTTACATLLGMVAGLSGVMLGMLACTVVGRHGGRGKKPGRLGG